MQAEADLYEIVSNVPSSILSLPNLTYLKIKGGTFTSLCHLKIKSSPKIKDLLIFKTKLKNIPKWSYELEHLEHLNVSDNKIENISEEIGRLNLLKRIILDNNKLKTLPAAFYRLSDLHHISIDNNPLEELEKENLRQLFSLTIN